MTLFSRCLPVPGAKLHPCPIGRVSTASALKHFSSDEARVGRRNMSVAPLKSSLPAVHYRCFFVDSHDPEKRGGHLWTEEAFR